MKIPSLFLPALFAASVVAAGQALDWTTTQYARIEGGRLVVDVPPGEEAAKGGLASAEIDLSPWDGRPVGAEITASGRGIGKPLHWYNGLKFQFEYEDPVAGDWFYPNTASRLGDFPEQTIRLGDFSAATRRKARLVLGLQEASGHAEFDLSSLRLVEPAPPWPVTNRTHRCAYRGTLAETAIHRGDITPRRGVMSPHRMTEDDFDTLQSWGATLIRYQMWGYRQEKDAPVDFEAYGRWLAEKLDHFDSFVLPQAAARGMKVVLDLHTPPGNRDAANDLRMCHDAECADFFVETWRRIAARFKGREGIYGYDLVNEPMQTSEALPGCDFWTLQKRAAEAIREIDPDVPVIVEANSQDSPSAFATLSPLDLANVIYEVHMYVPLRFTHQGVMWKQEKTPDPYPNAEKGWSAETLRGALEPVRDFQLRHGAKIYCGEFSAIAGRRGRTNTSATASRYSRNMAGTGPTTPSANGMAGASSTMAPTRITLRRLRTIHASGRCSKAFQRHRLHLRIPAQGSLHFPDRDGSGRRPTLGPCGERVTNRPRFRRRMPCAWRQVRRR